MYLGQSVDVFAFAPATGLPVLGDAANISVYLSIDDAAPAILTNSVTEKDSTKAKGWYNVVLTNAERQGTKFLFTAKSATSGVQVIAGGAVIFNQRSGGGVLNARIAYSSLAPDEFLEIIQGEEKLLTFIVEADGRFDSASANLISVKIKDPTGETVNKTNDDITRVTEELDIQVFRTTLTTSETNSLSGGLARIEIVLDTQKAVLTHAVKVIESL